jgi:hypothetical protein
MSLGLTIQRIYRDRLLLAQKHSKRIKKKMRLRIPCSSVR